MHLVLTGDICLAKKIQYPHLYLMTAWSITAEILKAITTYGNLYANAGIQYQLPLNKTISLTIGAYGNWKQKLNASQDILRETYYYDETRVM